MVNADKITSLVSALGKGSVEAFDTLYRMFRPKVDRVLVSVVGGGRDSQIISDLAQNIFLKIWEKRSWIAANVRDFDSYLFKMTRNEVLNYVQRQVKVHDSLREDLRVFSTDDIQHYVEGNEIRGRMAKLVAALPPQRRTVFELSRMEHLSNQEIAARMGLSLKTVERHMSLALQDLKKSMN